MNKKTISGIVLTLMLINMLTLAFNIREAYALTHDVAVTAVETSKTVCGYTHHPINVVYENYNVDINATVENKGDSGETFNVTAKYDSNVIDTIVDLFLAAHTSTNVTFTWDTTGVARDNYTITVEADVVPEETNTTDNTYLNGWIVVTSLGDFDGDFDVDQFDFWYFCIAFMLYYETGYMSTSMFFDYDADCNIDMDDFWTFCDAFIDYYKTK